MDNDFSGKYVYGSLGETLIKRSFIDAGFHVYNYGIEHIINNTQTLASHNRVLFEKDKLNYNSDDLTLQKIKLSPDFIIQRADQNIFRFIEVKTSRYQEIELDKFIEYYKYWGDIFIAHINTNNFWVTFYEINNNEITKLSVEDVLGKFPGFKFDYINNNLKHIRASMTKHEEIRVNKELVKKINASMEDNKKIFDNLQKQDNKAGLLEVNLQTINNQYQKIKYASITLSLALSMSIGLHFDFIWEFFLN